MKQGTPLVSVCIPVYNGEKYLRQCIVSVLQQSYPNLEIVIVDDYSSDDSIKTVKSFNDSRIKLYQNSANLGLVDNWNKCIEYSNGEWIKFVLQDDYISQDMIEIMMKNISSERKLIACNREFVFDDQLTETTRVLYKTHVLDLSKTFSINNPSFINSDEIVKKIVKFRYRNFIGEPTSVLFRKDVTKEIGVFNNQLGQYCDLEYWLRIASRYGLFYIPETLASFRVHNEATSSLNRENKRELLDFVIILKDLLYSDIYIPFRNRINTFQKAKLRMALKRDMHILKSYLKNHPGSELHTYYLDLLKKNPAIEKLTGGSFIFYLLQPFIQIRRWIFKKFKVLVG